MDLPIERDVCAEARHDFAQFYLLASLEDELLMDALVRIRAALLPLLNVPRQFVPAVIRDGLEKTTNTTERSFTDFRELVRSCPTFARIDADVRAEIERRLFEIWAAGTE